MGASTATGSLGYIRMVKELKEEDVTFNHIYSAAGSAGTLAGILAGCELYNLRALVRGIAVCDDADYFSRELGRIEMEFKRDYGVSFNLSGVEGAVDDRFVGLGYSLNTMDELKLLHEVAAVEGLLLDPVYTLKAFSGMLSHVKEGKIKPGENVLFVHTGGHSGLFAKTDEIATVL